MNDYIKNNFLYQDHEQAEKQLDCYFYNINLSNKAIVRGQMDKSIVYLENAKRSANELAEMKSRHNKAWNIIKRIESDRTMAEMLVKAYH